MSETINAHAAPKAVGNYPHARRVGNLLFLSGIGPRDPASNQVPGNEQYADGRVRRYDIAAQTHAVFANVRAVLLASGAHMDDLVDVTVYLTDMLADFRIYNQIWSEYFPDAANAPCRTTVGITALPTAIAIELKCTAVLKD
ncbi:MAG: RidA family protein [Xanthomonadaceae bacterium]|nr:RidA family protein [Xanthomonadaceae bacterium]